jgi:hypothetical protein
LRILVHTCNLNSSGGGIRRIMVQGNPRQKYKSSEWSKFRRTRSKAQEVKGLPCKHVRQGHSITSTIKRKKKEEILNNSRWTVETGFMFQCKRIKQIWSISIFGICWLLFFQKRNFNIYKYIYFSESVC